MQKFQKKNSALLGSALMLSVLGMGAVATPGCNENESRSISSSGEAEALAILIAAGLAPYLLLAGLYGAATTLVPGSLSDQPTTPGGPLIMPPLDHFDPAQVERLRNVAQSLAMPYAVGSPQWEGYEQRLLVLRGDAHVPSRYVSPDSTTDYAQAWWEGHRRADDDYQRLLRAILQP